MRLVIWPAIAEARSAQLRAAAEGGEVINAETPERARDAIVTADAFFGKLTPELLAAATRLRWVQSPTASLEHYLFPELVAHPCVLTNMRGLFHDVIADHVFGFILCFARNLHVYLRRQQRHLWEPVGGEGARPGFHTGAGVVSEIDLRHRHLAGCTLGVVGVGSIGSEVCRRGQAFGMTVRGVDPLVRHVPAAIDEVWPVERLPELLASSDFVVVAAPHTPETERLFRAPQFRQMKPTAYLINVGRGAIVDLTDLTDALQRGIIAGAGLDVFETEPLPAAHPLWDLEQVLITPHVAAASPVIAGRHLKTLVENVRRFVHGEELLNRVDKHRWF
jgi:phosphoglycerate dehydrogenase-like enzyme